MSESAAEKRPELATEFVRAESHFHRCLEKLPVGAYTCDADGLITYFNAAAARAWGRAPKINDPADRFCGSFKLHSTTGEPVSHKDCWMGLALRHKKEFLEEEVVVERPDGTRLTILAHASPLHDDEGNLVGAVNILIDIEERKQAADALRIARESADSLNLAKDQFLAVLSHELRTPLSPVVMAVAAIESDPELPEKFREDIVRIRRNIELESKLIDDLLDVSRAITGRLSLDKRTISAHDKLRHVLQNCTSDVFTKRINIRSELRATNDHILGDPARIQQVFWNLLRNATKFTPEGGEISIRTWNDPDGTLNIEVRDSGIGMDPDILSRIFNPFEQGNPKVMRQFGGMGLGLAITKTIVEMHGGTVTASSEGKDRGAIFFVRFPTTGAAPLQSAAPKAAPGAPRARILLVEDHVDTAVVLERLLQHSGYRVKVATSGAKALQLAATDEFDVMISDIGLPDVNGYELIRQLKQRGKVRGIAMSGYGTEEDIERSRQAGFIEHLVKPIKVPQLEAALERVIGS